MVSRTLGDLMGGYTYIGKDGCSTVDYILASDNLMSKKGIITKFKIDELIIFSDHRILYVSLHNFDINRDKKTIGVELHSGKNRIIRRLFEALGYNVVKLDRTVFAGLNKKNLPRGNYRFLTGAEITQLKMM